MGDVVAGNQMIRAGDFQTGVAVAGNSVARNATIFGLAVRPDTGKAGVGNDITDRLDVVTVNGQTVVAGASVTGFDRAGVDPESFNPAK